MPLLMTRWGLADASAGMLFTAQFGGQTLATFASSIVAARLSDRRTLALGFAVAAVGIMALSVAPWPLGIAAAFTYGLGLGLVLPTSNFVVASLRPLDSAAALSLLNVSWGVGAVVWPPIVRASMGVVASDAAPLTLLGVACLALAGILFGSGRLWPSARPDPVRLPAPSVEAVPTRNGVARVATIFGVASFLYVGAETSIGGWIAEFTRRVGSTGSAWTLAPTAFWGAETLGRVLAPLALRRLTEARMFVAGVSIAAAGVLVLISGQGGTAGALGGAVVAGLGLAPVFPLILAAMARHVAPLVPSLMGPLFAMGGLGGATLPWLVGLTSTRTGALGAGLLVPLLALVGVLGAHMIGPKASRK